MNKLNKVKTPRGVNNLLRQAAHNGDLSTIKQLATSLRANSKDQLGNTALILAAKSGHTACVDTLMAFSNLCASNLRGETALMWAAASGHTEICKILANKKTCAQADIDGNTPLILAAFGGHSDCIEILIPLSDLNARLHTNGLNALMAASANNHRESAQMLALISDIHAVNSQGLTASEISKSLGFFDLSLLLDEKSLSLAQARDLNLKIVKNQTNDPMPRL